jgi:subtilisin
MTDQRQQFTRRDALRLTGGAVGAVAATGVGAGASTETVRANVGYDTGSARRATLDAASEVLYEFVFDALTVTISPSALDDLRARSDVRYAETDVEVEALAQTLPYGIDRVDAEVAHADGETGDGADVAIIDTGIDRLHTDLSANLGEGERFIAGAGLPVTWQDNNGHGTHCAGIADAADNSQGVVGVSTQATLHAVKVLTGTGVGLTSDVAAGIEYAADQGWDVGSLSLGGGDSAVLKDACTYAYEKGVLLVAAAGNSGPCTDCVGFPAAYEECIAVSATDRNDDLADFSSTGPEVELAAPGVNVYSTFVGNTYTELSGTSMSCPHVAGAGGQLMANGYTNTEARDRLGSTAEDIGLASNEQGNGLLDVAAALGLDSSDDLGSSTGASGDGTAPTATIDGLAEQETSSPHAEFVVDWSAHDDDGDLDTVDLTLSDATAGGTEDTADVDASGADASGTTTLKAHKDDGSGHDYDVDLRARDANGNVGTDAATVTESE